MSDQNSLTRCPMATDSAQLRAHATALTQYATRNEAFSCFLYAATQHLAPSAASPSAVSTAATTWLAPRSETAAVARTHWLLDEINLRPDGASAAATLLSWRERIDPKDAVIGIVGIAIPGPTLGIIETKKKPKSLMPIITTAQTARNIDSAALATLTIQTSVGLLGQQLRIAGGSAYRLVPELADWCFAEQPTQLAVAPDRATLEALTTHLRAESLPHYRHEGVGEVLAVAICPSVERDLLAQYPIEDLSEATEKPA